MHILADGEDKESRRTDGRCRSPFMAFFITSVPLVEYKKDLLILCSRVGAITLNGRLEGNFIITHIFAYYEINFQFTCEDRRYDVNRSWSV